MAQQQHRESRRRASEAFLSQARVSLGSLQQSFSALPSSQVRVRDEVTLCAFVIVMTTPHVDTAPRTCTWYCSHRTWVICCAERAGTPFCTTQRRCCAA